MRARTHNGPASAITLALVFIALSTATSTAAPPATRDAPPLSGYICDLPSESEHARAARHAEVVRRLKGTPILVHRGASKIAPENTLEAYAAALDRGADGIEIDIRRSADGVLYIMHDEELGRTIEGKGPVKNLSYYELLRCRLKTYGTADASTSVPTLAAVLHLVRQRAMLLHLDIKEPDLEAAILKALDQADVWDHVVRINDYNSQTLRGDPRYKPLGYKGWLEEAGDGDDARRQYLARPQKMIFVGGDPADAAKLLGRPTIEPVPLPTNVRINWTPTGPTTCLDQSAELKRPRTTNPVTQNATPPAPP